MKSFRYDYCLSSGSTQETLRAGFELARQAGPGDVICLYGDLGAGKTHFAKGIASYFGIPPEQVDSPTFILLQEYAGTRPVYHFDAYRLGSAGEAREMGFEDYIYGDGISVVEWPGRVAELLPPQRTEVHISHCGVQQRRIEVVYKT